MTHNSIKLLNDKVICTQSNELILSFQKMDLLSKKLFILAVSHLRFGEEELKPMDFLAKDIMNFIGLKPNVYYKLLNNIKDNLATKIVKITNKDKTYSSAITIFSKIEYFAKNYKDNPHNRSFVRIHFNNLIKEHLLQLSKCFTSIPFLFLNLKTFYNIRMLEILWSKSFNFTDNVITIDLDELKSLLGIESGEYVNFKDFRRRILEPAEKEINERTPLKYSYKVVTKWNKVVSLIFSLEYVAIREKIENVKLLNSGEEEKQLVEKLKKAGIFYKEYDEYVDLIKNGGGIEVVSESLKHAVKLSQRANISNPPGLILDLIQKQVGKIILDKKLEDKAKEKLALKQQNEKKIVDKLRSAYFMTEIFKNFVNEKFNSLPTSTKDKITKDISQSIYLQDEHKNNEQSFSHIHYKSSLIEIYSQGYNEMLEESIKKYIESEKKS